MRRRVCLIVAIMVLAGCAAQPIAPPGATPGPTTTPPPPTPLPITGATCDRNNANDACLGPFAAGTQNSVLFAPRITFDIPAGWYNHEDSPGAYVLYPPGSQTPASEGGARDWIAFLENVTFNPVGCVPQPFDEGATAADIANWMAARANLVTTTPEPVNVGGLDGLVLDLRLSDDATIECFPGPGVFLVHGLGASEGYDQGIGPGVAMRFYFFDHGDDVLMIEIDDVSGGDRLDEFSAVLETVQFSR